MIYESKEVDTLEKDDSEPAWVGQTRLVQIPIKFQLDNIPADHWRYSFVSWINLSIHLSDTLYIFLLASYTVVKDVSLKTAFAAAPAAIATPAFAMDSIVEAMPSTSVALEVQFGAYLAILLGTFLPCLFLINLFIQTESRKAGREGGQDAE